SNVLSEQAKQQVIALGRLGWSLRRIQQETGVRRETASVYLRAAGIQVPPPGRRKQRAAKPAISVTTGIVSSKSLMPNTRFRSAHAKRPKLATCMSPQAGTVIPVIGDGLRSWAIMAAPPRRNAKGDPSIRA